MTTDRSPHDDKPIAVGVIGVGSMGEKHARVYSELRDVDLVGVADLDRTLARSVAMAHGTTVQSFEALIEHCDAVSVAVPTHAHEETVTRCLEAGVDVLVEKPIAPSVEAGRRLSRRATELDRVLQVGHIERFNPAVQAVADIIGDLEVLAIEAERLGPPVDRTARDGVTLDLMIHDVDVIHSLLSGEEPTSIAATGTEDGQYATAAMQYDDGVVATVTASRITQKKVRHLTITARECLVEVDYLDQTVLIHRESYPEYVIDDGQNRYRHESVVERPRVQNREPLRCELESFVEAVRTGTTPEVTAEDGIRALETVQTIDRLTTDENELEVRVR